MPSPLDRLRDEYDAKSAGTGAGSAAMSPLDRLRAKYDAEAASATPQAEASVDVAPAPSPGKITRASTLPRPAPVEPGARLSETDKTATAEGWRQNLGDIPETLQAAGGGAYGSVAKGAANLLRGAPDAALGMATFPAQAGYAIAEPQGQRVADALMPPGEAERNAAAGIGIKDKNIRFDPMADARREVAPNATEQMVGEMGVDAARRYAPGFTDENYSTSFAPPAPAPGEEVGMERALSNPWSTVFDAAMLAGPFMPKGAAPMRVEKNLGTFLREKNAMEGTTGPVPEAPPPAPLPASRQLMSGARRMPAETPGPMGVGTGRYSYEERPQTVAPPPAPAPGGTRTGLERFKARDAKRAAMTIKPGEEVTVAVGDKSVRMTPEHTLDPVLRRMVERTARGDYAAAGQKPGQPIPKVKPFQGPVTGMVPPKVRMAPGFKDVVTDREYPVRFTGEADQSTMAIEPKQRLAARKAKGTVGAGLRGTKGQKGSVDFGPVIDAATAAKDRTIEMLKQGARGVTWLGNPATRAYEAAAKAPILSHLGDGLRYLGDNSAEGWAAMGDALGRKANEKLSPRTVDILRHGQEQVRDLTVPVTSRLPIEWQKIWNRVQVDLRNEHTRRLGDALKATEGWTKAEAIEATFQNTWGRESPGASRAVKLGVRRNLQGSTKLTALMAELGERKIQHGLILRHTHEARSNYQSHKVGREAIRDAMFDAGEIMPSNVQRAKAKGLTTRARTNSDAEWMAANPDVDFRSVMAHYARESVQLDKLDGLRMATQEPSLMVPTWHLHAEKALRVEQSVLVENARASGLKTVHDMLAHIDEQIHREKQKRAALGEDVRPLTGDIHPAATPTEAFLRIDKKITHLADDWEKVTQLANEGVTLLDDDQSKGIVGASKHVATKQAAAQYRLDDMPNEVQRVAAQTGKTYVTMEEAMRRSGLQDPKTAAMNEWLGDARGAYVNEDMASNMGTFQRVPHGPIESELMQYRGTWQQFVTNENHTSHMNQSLGAGFTAALSGRFPLRAQAWYVTRALHDILSDSPSNIEWAREGLRNEIDVGGREILAKIRQFEDGAKTPTLVRRFNAWLSTTTPAKVYGAWDMGFRRAMADYNHEVLGTPKGEAAALANKWVPDPRNAPPLLRKITERGGIWSFIFSSIPFQQMPLVMEGAARNPVLFAGFLAGAAGTAALAVKMGTLTQKELDKRNKHRSRWERFNTWTNPINGAEYNMANVNPLTSTVLGRQLGTFPGVVANMLSDKNAVTGKPKVGGFLEESASAIHPDAKRVYDTITSMFPEMQVRDENRVVRDVWSAATKALLPSLSHPTTKTLKIRSMARTLDRLKAIKSAAHKLGHENFKAHRAEFKKMVHDVLVEEGWREDEMPVDDPDAFREQPVQLLPSPP